MKKVYNKYPIYIVSKGRYETRLTSKTLEYMKVPYKIIIEVEEYNDYAKVINPEKILILPKKYLEEYDVFDNLGNSKSKGPGAARNFAWEHSIIEGHKRHWVMDDNINLFFRFNNNLKVPVSDGTIFKCMEEFCDRYKNITMAGPNYFMFVSRKSGNIPAYVTNTRIYSCNLIKNDIKYRWRGRYNEDTDLSLRMLKDGFCTIQFNAFLQGKSPNQSIKGGNTKEFYHKEGVKVKGEYYAKGGTFEKSKMQVAMHPDVSKLVWKFGRWHHYVDYNLFKRNKLIKKEGLNIPDQINNYGMKLIKVK